MVMNYGEVGKRAPEKFRKGVNLMDRFATALLSEGLLPEKFSQKETDPNGGLNRLGLAVLRYNLEPHTPELITSTWQATFDYWTADAKKRGVKMPDIEVPVLHVDQEILERPTKDYKDNNIDTMTVFIPPELQGKDGLVLLGEMFPALQSRSVKKNTTIENKTGQSGYLNVETTLEAPNLNTNETELTKHFGSLEREGMNENVYILLSRFMKLIKGQFIDLKSASRLLGSRRGGDVVDAYGHSDGGVVVGSYLGSGHRDPDLGGRSVGVVQKT